VRKADSLSHQLIRAFRRVGRTDRALMRRSAALPASKVDDALMTLSKSANKSRLWWGVAALLATRQGATGPRCAGSWRSPGPVPRPT
jgi:hypothetical protein